MIPTLPILPTSQYDVTVVIGGIISKYVPWSMLAMCNPSSHAATVVADHFYVAYFNTPRNDKQQRLR